MTASLVIPYAPAQIAQGHTAFGVPMAGVSMPTYNTRGRTCDSRTGRVAIRPPGNPGVSMNMLIVLLPKDLLPMEYDEGTSHFSEYDDIAVSRMRTGEALASDLRFLAKYGLTKKLVIQRDGNLSFPPWHPEPLYLAPDELNQDIRQQFHELPFHFITPGYSNASQGQRYLHVDQSFTFQQLQFAAFQKKIEHIRAPDDSNTSLLYICPKGGPLIGPVEPNSPSQHFCFANCIMAHLQQGITDPTATPNEFFSPACKRSCPNSEVPVPPVTLPATPSTSSLTLSTMSSGSNSQALVKFPRYRNRECSASPHPAVQGQPHPPPHLLVCRQRQRSRSSSLESLNIRQQSRMSSTPLDNSVAVSSPTLGGLQPLPPNPSTSRSSRSLVPFPMFSQPRPYDVSGAPLVPFDSAHIHDLSDLSNTIYASVDLEYSESTLHFEADMLNDAVDGLINLLKHCHMPQIATALTQSF
ncbi:hypothetical protein EV702DRAFT_1196472 [Suillus placidus]|uniref:Uncharacterized protein n=1 Tax=Suillus placidus TaxID=48579 RepID=A0A9P6ZWG4_9AGAM|nr:hypothetical protein EV702DRAFT_1196472 [Suillus placidus]